MPDKTRFARAALFDRRAGGPVLVMYSAGFCQVSFADRAGSPVFCKANDATPPNREETSSFVTTHKIKGVQAKKRLPLPRERTIPCAGGGCKMPDRGINSPACQAELSIYCYITVYGIYVKPFFRFLVDA